MPYLIGHPLLIFFTAGQYFQFRHCTALCFCLAGGVPPVRARTGQFAPVASLRSALGGVPPVRARTGQFAPVASLRSALHSDRTFIIRGLYLIYRCGFDSDVLQLYPMRNYNFRFAASFRFCLAGGVPPLSIRGGRSTSFRSALIPIIHYSRS